MLHRRLWWLSRCWWTYQWNGFWSRSCHYLLLESPQSSALYHRSTAQRLFISPISTYALPKVSYSDYSNNYRQTWSALTDSLPYNGHRKYILYESMQLISNWFTNFISFIRFNCWFSRINIWELIYHWMNCND